MNYMTTKEAAKQWSISERMVVYHCAAGRVCGAQKMGNTWLLPREAEKPADGRRKGEKYE